MKKLIKWSGLVCVLGCSLIFALSSSARAANIAWVSFHDTDAGTTTVTDLGYPAAPDKGYTDLLASAGHSVTRILTKDSPTADDATALNGYDLVIIGRSVNSGNYQQADETVFWDATITKPVMLMSGYTLRNSRLGFTTGGTIPDTTGNVKLHVADPSHPIFAGIALDGGDVMVNDYAGIVLEPFGTNQPQRGISVNTDPLVGGTLLASISTAGDPADGGTIIAEWAAGDMVDPDNPADPDLITLGGHRLVFLSGSRERDTISSQTAGALDLTADGSQMFLNAVAYMAIPEPTSAALFGIGFGVLALRRKR